MKATQLATILKERLKVTSSQKVVEKVDEILAGDLRGKLEARLEALKNEHKTGVEMLADLDRRRAELMAALTKISGAIQVLTEELAQEDEPGDEQEPA